MHPGGMLHPGVGIMHPGAGAAEQNAPGGGAAEQNAPRDGDFQWESRNQYIQKQQFSPAAPPAFFIPH